MMFPLLTGVAVAAFMRVAFPEIGLWRGIAANSLLILAIASVAAWPSVREGRHD